jgi:hypothetical protein
MIIAAEITDAETLTNSLPIRMVTISRRGSLRSRSISSMRGFLGSAHLIELERTQREQRGLGARKEARESQQQ